MFARKLICEENSVERIYSQKGRYIHTICIGKTIAFADESHRIALAEGLRGAVGAWLARDRLRSSRKISRSTKV